MLTGVVTVGAFPGT